MSLAAMLLAMAMLLSGGRVRTTGAPVAVAPSAPPAGDVDDPLAVASALDVFAACLSSGMAVAGAARATAPFAPQALADVLGRAADLLALGADAASVWTTAAPRVTPASTRCAGLPVGRRRREPLWRRRCPISPSSRGGMRPIPHVRPPNARRCSSQVRSASAICRPSSVSASFPWWSVWPVTCCIRACGEPSRGARGSRVPWKMNGDGYGRGQRVSTVARALGVARGGRVGNVHRRVVDCIALLPCDAFACCGDSVDEPALSTRRVTAKVHETRCIEVRDTPKDYVFLCLRPGNSINVVHNRLCVIGLSHPTCSVRPS